MLTHGYRIEPEGEFARGPTTASAESMWPRVNFLAADWVAALNRDTSGPYDVILALSVSNNGRVHGAC